MPSFFKTIVDGLANLRLLAFRSFVLTQKNQRSQDKPDPSGRFVGPFRAWVVIVLVEIVLVVIFEI